MGDEHDVKAQEIVAQTSPYRMSADDIACLNITKAIAAALREAVAAERKRCAEVAKRRRVAVWDTMKGGRSASHPAEEMATKALSDVIDAIEQGD